MESIEIESLIQVQNRLPITIDIHSVNKYPTLQELLDMYKDKNMLSYMYYLKWQFWNFSKSMHLIILVQIIFIPYTFVEHMKVVLYQFS